MKHLLLLVIVAACNIFNTSNTILAQTSQPIFTYNGGSIIVKPEYIDPFYFEDENTPDYLYNTIPVLIGNKEFVIKLSNYKGTENDGGYFRIIDIISDGRNILSLRQSNGWDIIPNSIRKHTSNSYFLSIPLSDYSVALGFIGHTYQSEPELLTIVVVKGNEAKLVFNKHFIIRNIETTNSSYRINLQDFPIEYLDDSTPANTAKEFKIWSENGILRFGGPYGILNR